VVCLRPTKVRALYSQIIGRGTRICPGKDHLLVLDFLWQAEEHSLVRPAHLIAEDEEEAEAITGKLGEDGDLQQARDAANADRTSKLAERLMANQSRRSSEIDPLELAVTLSEAVLADFRPTMPWQEKPPTEKQLMALKRFGIASTGILSKGHASVLLDRLFMRRQLGLATPKQVRMLRRRGHPRPETATFEEAREFIDAFLAAS
jgi:type I site-specific restriction endonuclease